MKRYRKPTCKDGELKLQWGKLPHDNPDILYINGEGTERCDSRLLHYVFSCRKFKPFSDEQEKSFIEELELRGYDITTIKFSIMKKKS
jgi:hypothetical protein